jgi:proteasome lid subunit RPN8/RPN11
MIEFLLDIEEHFKLWYPKEGCGVLAVQNGKEKWFPCTNVAENDDSFTIDTDEYMYIVQLEKITGVIHSHVNQPAKPSKRDINVCNLLNIPFYIFSYPEMDFIKVIPEKMK